MFPKTHLVRAGLALLAACSAASAFGQAVPTPAYQDPKALLEARVNDLFDRLTPDEKLSLLTGTGFTTRAIPRLGVPAMAMADAGQGVRGGIDSTLGPATLFPAGVTMASTWDPELVGRIGAAIGQEALNKGTGVQVLLGPAVNIHRSPLGGRNGEYFSEDPYLAGRLAVGYIQGMQGTGCAACIKALCRQQRGGGPGRRQCPCRRARPAGDLSARVRGGHDGGPRLDPDVLLQPGSTAHTPPPTSIC